MNTSKRIINISLVVCKILLVLGIIITFFSSIEFIRTIISGEILQSAIKCDIPFSDQSIPIVTNSGQVVDASINTFNISMLSTEIFTLFPYIDGILSLLKLILFCYFLYVSTKIVSGVKNNNPFLVKLFTLLKKSALFALIVGLFFSVKFLLMQHYIDSNFGFQKSSGSIDAYFAGRITGIYIQQITKFIIVPLIVFILAEILRQGAILKEEQESFI